VERKVLVLAEARERDRLPVEQQLIPAYRQGADADVERIGVGDARPVGERDGQRIEVWILRAPEPRRGDAQSGFGGASAEVQVSFDVIQVGLAPAAVLAGGRHLDVDDALSAIGRRDDRDVVDMRGGHKRFDHLRRVPLK
jgi:hypothetical protein